MKSLGNGGFHFIAVLSPCAISGIGAGVIISRRRARLVVNIIEMPNRRRNIWPWHVSYDAAANERPAASYINEAAYREIHHHAGMSSNGGGIGMRPGGAHQRRRGLFFLTRVRRLVCRRAVAA